MVAYVQQTSLTPPEAAPWWRFGGLIHPLPSQKDFRASQPTRVCPGRRTTPRDSKAMDTAPPWGLVDIGSIVARSGPGDASVAAIASRQHGLITVPQLLYAGLPRHSIAHRARHKRLHSIHRGVYLVGHSAITDIGRMAAAVLACGPNSFLSHRAAAFLWRLLDLVGPPDVTVIGAGRGHRSGIVVHRCTALDRRDLRRRKRNSIGLPGADPLRRSRDLRSQAVGVSAQQGTRAQACPSKSLRRPSGEDAGPSWLGGAGATTAAQRIGRLQPRGRRKGTDAPHPQRRASPPTPERRHPRPRARLLLA